jgi:hypothetical protein
MRGVEMDQPVFAKALEGLLNEHSQENASNTPDFILAEFLEACLAAWNRATLRREEWYGRNTDLRGLSRGGPAAPSADERG